MSSVLPFIQHGFWSKRETARSLCFPVLLFVMIQRFQLTLSDVKTSSPHNKAVILRFSLPQDRCKDKYHEHFSM